MTTKLVAIKLVVIKLIKIENINGVGNEHKNNENNGWQ